MTDDREPIAEPSLTAKERHERAYDVFCMVRDLPAEARAGDLGFEGAALLALAEDVESPFGVRGGHAGERVEQQVEALLPRQSTHRQQPPPTRRCRSNFPPTVR